MADTRKDGGISSEITASARCPFPTESPRKAFSWLSEGVVFWLVISACLSGGYLMNRPLSAEKLQGLQGCVLAEAKRSIEAGQVFSYVSLLIAKARCRSNEQIQNSLEKQKKALAGFGG